MLETSLFLQTGPHPWQGTQLQSNSTEKCLNNTAKQKMGKNPVSNPQHENCIKYPKGCAGPSGCAAASQDAGFTSSQEKCPQNQNCWDGVRYSSSCLAAYCARAVCELFWLLRCEEKLHNMILWYPKPGDNPRYLLGMKPKVSFRNDL